MVDDTLSPIGFQSTIVKTMMAPQERYVLSCLLGSYRGTQAALVREVMTQGLEARGWDEAKRIEAYAQFKVRCIKFGVDNPYESE